MARPTTRSKWSANGHLTKRRKSDFATTRWKPEYVWTWTSGVVPASANNQQYKATFKIGGELIDPDVVCGDPPPSPQRFRALAAPP